MKKLIFVRTLKQALLPVLLAGIMVFAFTGCQVNDRFKPGKTVSSKMPPPPPAPKPFGNSGDSSGIYKFAEQMPQFPGGRAALMKYLSGHIHYPKKARKEGIQGTVVVQFVVNTNGNLSDIKTIGPRKGGGLEEEAIRVVENMPEWVPGKQDGKAVAVQYALPVRYVIQ